MKEIMELTLNKADDLENSQLEQKTPEKKELEKTHQIDFYATTHMVDDPEHWQPDKFREHAGMLKKSGVDFLAYDWSWTRVNPKPGDYDETQIKCYQEAKQIMKQEGLKPPTVIFTVTPDFAKELYNKGDKEKFFENYEAYVTKVKDALVASGGEKIETFQIFNELNVKGSAPCV